MNSSELLGLRTKWRLSQSQMAMLLRMRPEQISKMEHGAHGINRHLGDWLRSLDINEKHRRAMLAERGVKEGKI